MEGTVNEIVDFVEWFGALDYQFKIFIAGNHDYCLEGKKVEAIQCYLPENCFYLYHSGITINGVKFWGVPFFFSEEESSESLNVIKHIPIATDVLISHRPPLGILDNANNISYGCPDLLLKALVKRALVRRAGKDGWTPDVAPKTQRSLMIGSSPKMMDVYRTIASLQNSRTTVLIVGESGTGKELVAQNIHASSDRKHRPFVAINCGALTETLLVFAARRDDGEILVRQVWHRVSFHSRKSARVLRFLAAILAFMSVFQPEW
jgi:hypothetical protein